jgi:hypothetical protein
MQLFQYAVFCDEKRDKDGEVTDEASIITEPVTCLAKDDKEVALRAAKTIPDSYDDKLDRVVVVIHPF